MVAIPYSIYSSIILGNTNIFHLPILFLDGGKTAQSQSLNVSESQGQPQFEEGLIPSKVITDLLGPIVRAYRETFTRTGPSLVK